MIEYDHADISVTREAADAATEALRVKLLEQIERAYAACNALRTEYRDRFGPLPKKNCNGHLRPEHIQPHLEALLEEAAEPLPEKKLRAGIKKRLKESAENSETIRGFAGLTRALESFRATFFDDVTNTWRIS